MNKNLENHPRSISKEYENSVELLNKVDKLKKFLLESNLDISIYIIHNSICIKKHGLTQEYLNKIKEIMEN